MAIIIGTNDSGYVTYVNQPDVNKTLAENELSPNAVLKEVTANKIKSVVAAFENVEISSNLSVNIPLPASVPANGFLFAGTEDWNRPATGAAAFIVHNRKSGVTIFSTAAVTFPKIVLRFYYVDYDVKGDA